MSEVSSVTVTITTESSSNENDILDFIAWKYVAPTFIFLGCIQNTLSLIVLLRKRFHLMPSRNTLLALCVNDSFVLLVGMGRYWVHSQFDILLPSLNRILCKSLTFIVYSLSHVSSFLVALITIERALAICFAMKQRKLAIELFGVPFVYSLCILVNLLHIFTTDLYFSEDSNTTMVLLSTQFPQDHLLHDPRSLECRNASLMTSILVDILDILMLSILPLCVITVGNVSIIIRLRRNAQKWKRRRQAQVSDSQAHHLHQFRKKLLEMEATSNAVSHNVSTAISPIIVEDKRGNKNSLQRNWSSPNQLTVPVATKHGCCHTLPDNSSGSPVCGTTIEYLPTSSPSHSLSVTQKLTDDMNESMERKPVESCNFQTAKRGSKLKRSKHFKVTITLLLVTMTFLICNFPFAVIHVVRTAFQLNESSLWNDLWFLSYMLVYANNCLNFIIYLISNSLFRQELRAMFQCNRQ